MGARAAVDRLAEALLERETLAAADVIALAGATPLSERQRPRDEGQGQGASGTGATSDRDGFQ